jgi:hypothetical protein
MIGFLMTAFEVLLGLAALGIVLSVIFSPLKR